MAALTVIHRSTGTPSLAVAPTQNTAPVHEYRCLYTRDLHKKAKKWHDGSLRFHTFNSRVMVYDDANNFIGDLHYRQEEDFAEGIEIQLDRGIKVEVGDRYNETETDLAPILDRQRPAKAAVQTKQPVVGITRANTAFPSQRPKSLLEVLGPSQGRVGRSRLPLQSPYEQRQTFASNAPTEHTSKRPRLSFEKENQLQCAAKSTSSRTSERAPALPQQRLANPSKPTVAITTQSANAPAVSFEEVLDISSGGECQRTSLEAARLAAVSDRRRIDRQQTTEVDQMVATKRRSPSHRPAKRVQRRVSKKETVPRQKQTSNRIRDLQDFDAAVAPTTSRKPTAPTARLLLSQPRSRQKLTYLLPIPSTDLSHRRESLSSKRSSDTDRANQESPIHIESSSPLPSTPASSSHDSMHSPLSGLNIHDDDENNFSKLSPLFVPEDNTAFALPSPSPYRVHSNTESPDFGRIRRSASRQCTPNKEAVSAGTTSPLMRPSFIENPFMRAGFEVSEPELEPETGEHNAAAPNTEHSTPMFAHLSPRPFRRVFSELNAHQDDALVQESNGGVEARSPLKLLENPPARRNAVKSQSPSRVYRCASDTVVLETVTNFSLEQPKEINRKGDTGPWTSEEAFLLFDWWPSELEKPDLWKVAEEQSQPAIAPRTVQGFSTRITTARQFLHDDINAL